MICTHWQTVRSLQTFCLEQDKPKPKKPPLKPLDGKKFAVTHAVGKCIKLRADGLLTKQIADALCISIKTVNTHFAVALMQTLCKTPYQIVAAFAADQIYVYPPRFEKN